MSARNSEIDNKQHATSDNTSARHLSATENGAHDNGNRAGLLKQASDKYVRGTSGDSLDVGGHDKLYGSSQSTRPAEAARSADAPAAAAQRREVGNHADAGLGSGAQGAGARGAEHHLHQYHHHQFKHHQKPHHENEKGHEDKNHSHTEVEAKTVTAKQGDSLWKIAREHLGSKASENEVMHHVQDIAKANGMPDPMKPENRHNPKNIIHPGQELKLPGQTKDGPAAPAKPGQPSDAPVAPAKPGQPSDAPAAPAKPGQPSDAPAAPAKPGQPSDAPVAPAKPGQPSDAPAAPAKPGQPTDNANPAKPDKPQEVLEQQKQQQQQQLEEQKKRLEHNLDTSGVSAADKARIQDNMKKFEERADKDHLTPADISKTYEQANRLYESKGDSPISQADKQVLADQVINHAANPTGIDQGKHNTCGPTSLESRMFTSDPADAAKVIADAGTQGSYTAKDGSRVDLSQKDLAKDNEARTNPPKDGERSYASKLFQETALNLHYQQKGQRYEETPGNTPGDRSSYGKPDREQVIDRNGRAHDFQGVGLNDLSDMETKMTGKRDASHYLGNHSVYDNNADNRGKITTFNNEQQFTKALSDAKANGKMPLTMWVDSRQPPFGSGDLQGAGGQGGGHFVSVTDYDAKTGKVQVDNQWGSQNDHITDGGISTHQLYEASHPPEAADRSRIERQNQRELSPDGRPTRYRSVNPSDMLDDPYVYDLTRDRRIGRE